jgi:hypothetical protein
MYYIKDIDRARKYDTFDKLHQRYGAKKIIAKLQDIDQARTHQPLKQLHRRNEAEQVREKLHQDTDQAVERVCDKGATSRR